MTQQNWTAVSSSIVAWERQEPFTLRVKHQVKVYSTFKNQLTKVLYNKRRHSPKYKKRINEQ